MEPKNITGRVTKTRSQVIIIPESDDYGNWVKKRCPGCGELKERDDFSKNIYGVDSLRCYCRSCDNKKRIARKRRTVEIRRGRNGA